MTRADQGRISFELGQGTSKRKDFRAIATAEVFMLKTYLLQTLIYFIGGSVRHFRNFVQNFILTVFV